MVLLSSVLMCGGIWLLRRPLIGLLTEHTRIQQELEYVLPVVVAAVMCEWRLLST
jgi:Na+-driven multidrug efflux pump